MSPLLSSHHLRQTLFRPNSWGAQSYRADPFNRPRKLTTNYYSTREKFREPIDVADYLFRRLYEVGIRSVHGVPGDFNLAALDYVPKAGLAWTGSVNELNAGYAADGYARVNGMGALLTTFGVGELSAINAVAGAFAERIPIVHIVGCPSTSAMHSRALIHHTLGNGEYDVFRAMNAGIACHVAKLETPRDIAQQIDHAIRQCWISSQPVYIMLPVDMVQRKVEGFRLQFPIDLREKQNNAVEEVHVVEAILKRFRASKRPAMLVDVHAIRHKALDEVRQFAKRSNISTFVTPMGRGAFDETNPRYRGLYAGGGSDLAVRKEFESSDLIVSIGALECDLNTAGFSYQVSALNSVKLQTTHTEIGYAKYPGVGMKGVLRNLSEKIDIESFPHAPEQELLQPSPTCLPLPPVATKEVCPKITHAALWPRLSSFWRKGDIVVTDVGTSGFGIWATKFPPRVTALTQLLWGSLGWSVGACQGAALAAKDAEQDKRTILFVGDGALQLTVQELSTMIRYELNITIFCICNEGFTVERLLHGMDASYNDIASWKHKDLIVGLGGDEYLAKYFQIRTMMELDDLLLDAEFNECRRLQFVELHMDKLDAPASLLSAAQALRKGAFKT